MTRTEYAMLYSQGTREHERIILECANFTPEEAALFNLIRHSGNPPASAIEDALAIDKRQRARIEHGMRLKVAYIILEALREYGINHPPAPSK